MKNIIFVFLSLYTLSVSAQVKKASNTLQFSYTQQYYYDQNSMQTDGKPPFDNIRPANTQGNYWGLKYERTTRYGLVWSVGLQYGLRRYDINIVQDVTNFDPEAVNNLKGEFFTDRIYAPVKYLGPRFSVGYKLNINGDWAISASVGVAWKLFFDGLWEHREGFMSYMTDDSLESRLVEVEYSEAHLGREMILKGKNILTTNYFPNKLASYTFYFGIERQINKKFVKNISIGFDASRSWWMWYPNGEVTIWAANSYPNYSFNKSIFLDRDISVGIRLAIGLWK